MEMNEKMWLDDECALMLVTAWSCMVKMDGFGLKTFKIDDDQFN